MTDKINILANLLADNYALYLKTQNYHWNIEGVNFLALHKFFEEQYRDIQEAIDVLAELIREYGHKAPASFEEFIKLTSMKAGNPNFTSEEMVKDLLEDHLKIELSFNKAIEICQNTKDEVAVNFLVERLTFHKKTIWILKSSA